MKRSGQAWAKFLASRVAGLGIDALVLAFAYLGAFFLRFDFAEPQWGWRAVALSYRTVCAVSLVSLLLFGCYRFAWRRIGAAEIVRFVEAMLSAAIALTILRFVLSDLSSADLRPPYTITVLYFLLGSMGAIFWRLAWRAYAVTLVREDELLERSVRKMDSAAAFGFLHGKTVMVTGAGGSIGSELVRQVSLAAPRQILMVERGENALYEIDREMRSFAPDVPARPLMVDINDTGRMEDVFNFYRPEIILHAAAYKHVPMVEMNPREGERNNTEATRLLAELALKFRVKRFVMISTDKAVNPVSVMGRTKLAAERAIMALNADDAPTSFCAVRFGNVLGSSGSVVPLFREQIAHGGPVTVTHPDMKRYFMTVQEAVGLVLQAASRSEKAIYTLDMGEPVRIVDLAEDMIRQAGYKPYVDIPIRFVGIRPGEKLFEELDVSEKSAYKTDMARIYITKTEKK